MIRKLFDWVFAKDLLELKNKITECDNTIVRFHRIEEKLNNLLKEFDVSVDVHQYSPSWAVFSLQGEKNDYVKFVHLRDKDLVEISRFVSKFDKDKTKIDAMPSQTAFIKSERRHFRG